MGERVAVCDGCGKAAATGRTAEKAVDASLLVFVCIECVRRESGADRPRRRTRSTKSRR